MTQVAVLDYGSGNLHSVTRALAALGVEVALTSDPAVVARADGLVVPGVGAFAACMAGLIAVGGDEMIRSRLAGGGPMLGICVGHQVMFSEGVEHGDRVPGLGILSGVVEQLTSTRLPHMGWNTVVVPSGSRIFAGLEAQRFYFVHSYGVHAEQADDVLVTTASHEGDTFIAAIESGPLTTTQFHPEKSGAAGAQLLANWLATLS